MARGKMHLQTSVAEGPLCGRKNVKNVATMGNPRYVALTTDKCLACCRASTWLTIFFTNADRTRKLSSGEVAAFLKL